MFSFTFNFPKPPESEVACTLGESHIRKSAYVELLRYSQSSSILGCSKVVRDIGWVGGFSVRFFRRFSPKLEHGCRCYRKVLQSPRGERERDREMDE